MIPNAHNTKLFDLTILRSFVQVIDSKGYTAASQKLNLAQSTISVHVKKLEAMTNQKLIEKYSNPPVLTAMGKRLYHYAQKLLVLNTQAWHDLFEQKVKGVIRLGIPDDYLIYLPSVFSQFERNFPEVELKVHCGLSIELLQRINTNQLDLAITTRQPNTPGGEVLCKEPTIWAATKNYNIHHKSPLPLAVSRDKNCIFRKRAIEALNIAGIPWRIAYTSTSLSGLTAAVNAGLAITVLMPSMLPNELHIIHDKEGLPELPPTEIALHIHNHASNEEAIQRLADAIRHSIRQKSRNKHHAIYAF